MSFVLGCVNERTFSHYTPTGTILIGIERRSTVIIRLNSNDHLFGGACVSPASVTSRDSDVEDDRIRAVPEQSHCCRYDTGVRVDVERRPSVVTRLWVVTI